MSHTTTVKSVAIRDIAALRSAVEELQSQGIECHLEEGSNIAPRMYYQAQQNELKGKTPYVLRLKNSQFDVGFQKLEVDGEVTYAPVTDFHAGYIRKQLGAKCGCKSSTAGEADIGNLMHLYAKHAALNSVAASGYSVENMEYNEQTGEIHITVDASNYNGY